MTTRFHRRFVLLMMLAALACGLVHGETNNIVLLRTFVTTNTIPGWSGAPDTEVAQTNGEFVVHWTPAVLVWHPPQTVVRTNYVLGLRDGTNTTELFTIEK